MTERRGLSLNRRPLGLRSLLGWIPLVSRNFHTPEMFFKTTLLARADNTCGGLTMAMAPEGLEFKSSHHHSQILCLPLTLQMSPGPRSCLILVWMAE